jgi:hypothetical protein
MGLVPCADCEPDSRTPEGHASAAAPPAERSRGGTTTRRGGLRPYLLPARSAAPSSTDERTGSPVPIAASARAGAGSIPRSSERASAARPPTGASGSPVQGLRSPAQRPPARSPRCSAGIPAGSCPRRPSTRQRLDAQLHDGRYAAFPPSSPHTIGTTSSGSRCGVIFTISPSSV